MLIVGIDPGYTGAIAFLHPGSWMLTVHDMPVLKASNGKTELNHSALARLLIPLGVDTETQRHVGVLEKVWAFQGQGISSAFRFGECYGALRTGLIGHGYELHNPTPPVWKKHFKLTSSKDGSRKLAIERFPANAQDFARKKDDGRAEAALLALYGHEKLI